MNSPWAQAASSLWLDGLIYCPGNLYFAYFPALLDAWQIVSSADIDVVAK